MSEKILNDDWTLYLDEALDHDNIDCFRDQFRELHPYDQAKYFYSQSKRVRMTLYTYFSPDELAALFENVDVDEQEDYLAEMLPTYASAMLAKMYVDDAVDVLNRLDSEQIASYLAFMDADTAEDIRGLLHYKEETAGSLMTTEFVSIHEQHTVAEAMAILKEEAPEAETIYYVFVVDADSHLTGVISLRDMIISDEGTFIKDIRNDQVVSISVSADQEEAAKLMMDYDFLALPVVDFQHRLLGIITVDDIVDVIDEEATEDYSKLAAVADVDLNDSPIAGAKKRLPWLVVLLVMGMLTATLISQFEHTIKQVAILSAFIPVVAGTTGNSGTQSLAVVVRGLATGEFAKMTLRKHFLQEVGTAIITGICCGVMLAIIIFLWKSAFFVGLITGASLAFSIIIGTLSGSVVPLIMDKLKVDPAVASGPFITTICDIISMFIYFTMATAFMSYLL